MASAGSVIIDFLARTGSFETDVARARKSVEGFSKGVKDSFLGNLGAGFAKDFIKGLASIPGRMVDVVKGAIDAADHLNDLSKSTGVAVETLGGIGFAASQAGSSLDAAAGSIGKLNQTLAKAASGNKEASDALKALGVQAIDPLTGKTTTVDKALVQLANTFEKAGDSPEKFRAAAAALGKKYAELAPLLADGGKALQENIAYYKRFGGVSTETAQKADEFNDTMGKINLLTQSFSRTLAAEMLPSLQALANLWLKNKEEGDQFHSTATRLVDLFKTIAVSIAYVGVSYSLAAEQGGAFLAQLNALGNLDFDLAKRIREDARENLTAARKSFDQFYEAVVNPPPSTVKDKGTRPDIPGIPDASASAAAEAALKKTLDGQIKKINAFAEQQRDALAFANKFLEGEYQDGIVSLENFFGDQKNIRDRALKVQLDQQDKIIAAEEAFKKRSANPVHKIEAQDRIDEARAKKTSLTIKAGQEDQLVLQQNARDAKSLQDAFAGVNAQVLELTENFAAAAAAKFDLQNFELTKTITKNLSSPNPETAAAAARALQQQNELRAATITQAAFQKAALDSSRTLEDLSRAEDRLALSVQTGALTSLEALSKVGEERRKFIPILEAQAAAEEAIARASRTALNPEGNPTLIKNAEAARLALDKLKASADPLAESLNKTFGDDFNASLTDFVTGTKSAADAFKSFADSVLKDILRMGSKSLTEEIFGGSGGAGGFISDLFKGSSSSGGLVAALKGALGGSSGPTAPTQSEVDSITALFADSGATAAKASETAAVSASTAALTAFAASSGASTAALTAESAALGAADIGLTALAASASAAAAALTAVAATSAASSGSSLLGFASVAGISGGRADGGPVGAGQSFVVGERGIEVLHMGAQSGTVTPNHKLGGQTINVNVNVQGAPNQPRDSILQQGAAIGQGIQRAMARNT